MVKFGEIPCSFDGEDLSIDIPIPQLNGASNLTLNLSGVGYHDIKVKCIENGNNTKMELRMDSMLVVIQGRRRAVG